MLKFIQNNREATALLAVLLLFVLRGCWTASTSAFRR